MFKNADRVVGKGSAKTTVYESIDGHDEKWSECFEEGSGGRGGKGKQKLNNLRGRQTSTTKVTKLMLQGERGRWKWLIVGAS